MAAADEAITITATHTLDTVELPVNPKRVAVLDYGSLETIGELGDPPALAPENAGIAGVINTLPWCGPFITIREPFLTLPHHPEFIVHLQAHSALCHLLVWTHG